MEVRMQFLGYEASIALLFEPLCFRATTASSTRVRLSLI